MDIKRAAHRSLAALLQVLLPFSLLLAGCGPATPTRQPVSQTQTPAASVTASAGKSTAPALALTPAPSATQPAPTRAATTLEVDPAGLDGLTVQFWHAWSGETGAALDQLVKEFNDSNEWGIQVQATGLGSYDELSSSIEDALQKGEGPDITAAYLYQARGWGGEGDGEKGRRGEGGQGSPTGTATVQNQGSPTPADVSKTGTPDGGQTTQPPKGTQALGSGAAETQEATGTPVPVRREVLIDLEPYVNDPTWGLTEAEQADFYPAFWNQDAVDGGRLGLPVLGTAQVLYYNSTWAQELGYPDPPAAAEDFRNQACAAAKASQAGSPPGSPKTGGWIVNTDYSAMIGWIQAFGGDILREDGSGYRFDTPEVEETFHFLRETYDQGCAWLAESDPPENEFAGRKGLFRAGSAAGLAVQAAAFQRSGSRDQWAALPFPAQGDQPAISVYGPSLVVLKTDPERQFAAWLFAKWLTRPENQAKLAQASGWFPVRISARSQMESYIQKNSQWGAALDLLEHARPEPVLPSWGTVRWAVSDAATQLFRYYFTIDKVPELVKLLDSTAQELNNR